MSNEHGKLLLSNVSDLGKMLQLNLASKIYKQIRHKAMAF